MKRLTDIEVKVIKHFNITATQIQMADNDEWMPPLSVVATFCMHNGYPIVYDKISAGLFLMNLGDKILEPEDAFSREDLAVWLLTNYFTREELEHMSYEDILKFLQDWKYFNGFRKDSVYDVMVYMYNAQAVFDGLYVLDEDKEEIAFKEVGQC